MRAKCIRCSKRRTVYSGKERGFLVSYNEMVQFVGLPNPICNTCVKEFSEWFHYKD